MLPLSERPRSRPPAPTPLVRAAAAGDQAALHSLVTRYDGLLRSVTRAFRLSPWDADDVIQATWLQFLEHGRTLREPAAVSGWLATTARRQSLRLLQRHVREHLTDDPAGTEPARELAPEGELLASERQRLLDGALAQLPDHQQRLMRVLLTQPELSYEEVSRMLGMPIGSIGPTRARSLDRLRRDDGLRALQAAGA